MDTASRATTAPNAAIPIERPPEGSLPCGSKTGSTGAGVDPGGGLDWAAAEEPAPAGEDVALAPAGAVSPMAAVAGAAGSEGGGAVGAAVGDGPGTTAGGWPHICSNEMSTGAGALMALPLPHFHPWRSPFPAF